jgi:hypothetical protein
MFFSTILISVISVQKKNNNTITCSYANIALSLSLSLSQYTYIISASACANSRFRRLISARIYTCSFGKGTKNDGTVVYMIELMPAIARASIDMAFPEKESVCVWCVKLRRDLELT